MWEILRTDRSHVQLEWSLPLGSSQLSSRLRLNIEISRALLPRTRCEVSKRARRRRRRRSFAFEASQCSAEVVGARSCFLPPRHRVAQRGHPAGFNGCTARRSFADCAADEPDASSSAEVNRPLHNRRQCTTAQRCRSAFTFVSAKKEDREKRFKKKKKKGKGAHHIEISTHTEGGKKN